MATIEQKATEANLPDWLANLPPIVAGMGREVESHVALGAGDWLPIRIKTNSPGVEREKARKYVLEGHQVSSRLGRWWVTLRIYQRTSHHNAQFHGEPDVTMSRVGTVEELLEWAGQFVEVERRNASNARPHIARA
jgi:hypothetical protein